MQLISTIIFPWFIEICPANPYLGTENCRSQRETIKMLKMLNHGSRPAESDGEFSSTLSFLDETELFLQGQCWFGNWALSLSLAELLCPALLASTVLVCFPPAVISTVSALPPDKTLQETYCIY